MTVRMEAGSTPRATLVMLCPPRSAMSRTTHRLVAPLALGLALLSMETSPAYAQPGGSASAQPSASAAAPPAIDTSKPLEAQLKA